MHPSTLQDFLDHMRKLTDPARSRGAGTLLLWEVASGRLRNAFKGNASALFALTFSPNGRLLAAWLTVPSKHD